GWEILKQCGVRPDTNTQTQCTVANNTSCESIGSVSLPVSLEDKCHLIKALIVPAIPHEIILGVDFWIAMDIVPNLKLGTWAYASSLSAEPTNKATIQTLSETQQHALNTVLEKFPDLLTDTIGRTNVHEITRHTPHFLNHGKQLVLSGDSYGPNDEITSVPAVDRTPIPANHHLSDRFTEVRHLLQRAYLRNKSYYDLRRRPEEFRVGQLVWRKNYVLSD
ncbi:hypothetical protein CBL_21223, partial [Carabus blaptoides fortunei]